MPEEGLDGPVFRREGEAVVHQDVAAVAVSRVVFGAEPKDQQIHELRYIDGKA